MEKDVQNIFSTIVTKLYLWLDIQWVNDLVKESILLKNKVHIYVILKSLEVNLKVYK